MEEELPQLESANIQRMLKGLSMLEQETRKQRDDTYQEYQRAAIEALKPSFISVIKSMYAQPANSKFLNNIVTNHAKYFSCLLAYGEQIAEAMSTEVWGERGEEESALFALSHRAFTSQSVLFAFLLAKRTLRKVTLIATEDSLLRAGHIVAGNNEEDKLSFVRSALSKEGIGLIELREWDRSTPLPADSFAVIDVFGLSPLQYAPFLLRGGWKSGAVYHSHLQDAEVAGVLSSVGKAALPLQLWPQHPTEAQAAKDETALLRALLDFLAEDRAHPQKQDAVIFFPVETHPKRFAAKLGEALSKAELRDCVNVITRAHQPQPRTKNNVFLAEGSEQLLAWNYDYANVVYAVDYGTQKHITFNYELCAYQEIVSHVSPLERARRQSLIGDSHFGIYSYLANKQLHRIDDLDRAKDITTYILRMIDYGLQAHLDLSHSRVKQALALLERLHIIGREGDFLRIIDQKVLSYTKQGIPPIQSCFILNVLGDKTLEKQTMKYATLAIFMCVCLHTKQSIRKHRQDQGVHRSKPTEMWRKGGYVESCLAIIAECESQELYMARESQSQSFRRASSKMEESESDPFGSFYQLIEGPNGIQAQKISIPNFLQENSIDEDVFFMVREEIDHYRDLFNVPKLSVLSDNDYFRPVLRHYVQLFRDSLLYYSGFMRKGYRSDKLGQYIEISPQSLKRWAVKPHFISVMRLQVHLGKRQITQWNTVREVDYIQAAGGLPIAEKLSKQEVEVQFHGISSLLFEKLWRNNGLEVLRFEEENECFVEANQEMALIIVHCSRQREKEIQEKFDAILTKIRTNFQASKKLTNYFGNIKFYVGAGGAVKEMVIGQYVSKGLVESLSLDVTKEDLQELIEEFIVVRDINMRLPQPGQQTKSAVIFFNSQRDYYVFYDYFNDCEYLGNKLKISPVRRSKIDSAWERYSIKFQWSVWQSHCKAIIRFVNKASAVKAYEAFSANPTLDGSNVAIRLQERALFIDELNELTDESFLEQVFKEFGVIEEVDILKTPLREAATDILELQNVVKGSTQHGKFTMKPVIRGNNGLRSCVFVFQNPQDVMKVVSEHHKSIGRVGVSRLYALPHFQRSMQISKSLRSASLAILEQIVGEYQEMNLLNRKLISYDLIEEQIVFRSPDKVLLDSFFNTLSTRMRGENVKLKKGEKALLFNEIGLANLMDLEEKYNCKLVVNVALQTLAVIARKKIINSIMKEITSRIVNSFFYKIHLNSKSYRHFRSHPEILAELKDKHKLKLVQLESDQQSIILQGGILAIQSANVYLMFLVQSINQPEESRVHSDVCGICCEQPKSSYRLQSCFHRFCTQCMQQYIRNVLGDASQFPLKCPHCCQLIIVQDLALILDKGQWQKSDTLGINRFMSDHSDTMSFCYTAGCKQINIYNGPFYNCDTCKFSYCNKCKEIVHPGFSCDQAIEIRQTDAYFLKYMAENGIRKCPNGNCGMPVVKIDGCNKVLCTRCGKSMCFKCPPEVMIAYDTPQQAYDHLNSKHGGYW